MSERERKHEEPNKSQSDELVADLEPDPAESDSVVGGSLPKAPVPVPIPYPNLSQP